MISEVTDLCHEHCSRWNFHVVTEFEVLEEGDSLCHTNVSIHLKAHVSNRISWVYVSNNVLGDDVQARCLKLFSTELY